MANRIIVNLDTSKSQYNIFECKQNDDLILEANIFENGIGKDITNATVTINCTRADGTYVIQNTDITKEGKKLIANLKRDFTRVDGLDKLELTLIENEKQNTTFDFNILVKPSVLKTAVEESKDTVIILEELGNKIVEAGQVKAETEQLIATGGAATKGDIATVNSQLEQNAYDMNSKIFYNNIQSSKKTKSLITILDDDTRRQLYDIIYPLLKEYNIPITSAAITNRIGTSGYITLEQYNEMRDSHLVEFISHTSNHLDLSKITLIEAENELIESKNWLIKNRGNADYIVPPFGGTSPEIRSLMRKYYKGAFVTNSNGYLNSTPLQTFSIKRCDFESTLEQQKAWVDEAVKNGTWLIFNTHSQYDSFTAQGFRDLIEYANSVGLEFATVGEAMKHFANILDIDDNPTSSTYAGIDANGKRFGEMASCFYVIDATNVKFDTPATYEKFKVGKTVCHFSSSLASSYGWPSAGTLETVNTGNPSYIYQNFVPLNTNDILHRFWNGSSWSSLEKITSKSYYRHIDRTNITADKPISEFDIGISVCHFTASLANSYGFPGAGVLITNRVDSDSYSYQRYILNQKNIEYNRYWTGSGWSPFIVVSGNYKASTVARNKLIADYPSLEIGYQCYDTTLQIPIYWDGSAWKKYSDNTTV